MNQFEQNFAHNWATCSTISVLNFKYAIANKLLKIVQFFALSSIM